MVELLVHADPADVWAVLADGWLYPGWVVGATRMRAVDEGWPAAGTSLHHSVGVWPGVIDDSTTVIESEPLRRLRLKARAWPAGAAEVDIELVAQPAGTLVRMSEDVVGGVAKVVPRLLRQQGIIPRNKESLRRLAFLAEGRR